MTTGASTPEELESLLEDGFMLTDRIGLAKLFDGNAVLCADHGSGGVRGSAEVVRAAAALCERGYSYLARPRRLLQSGDTALMVGERAINVMRRGPDRRWRYAISLLETDGISERSKQ
jgi:hypothetical protein